MPVQEPRLVSKPLTKPVLP